MFQPISIKIVKASIYEMILGVDFLSKYRTVIDLEQCALKIEDSLTIPLLKQETDVNELPTLNCASDAIIPPHSFPYLACTLIGSICKSSNVMWIAGTAQFSENTGLALTYDVVDLHEPLNVQVANLSDEPVLVKNGTWVSRFDECEQLPYSISKSIPTNFMKPSDNRYLRLSDLKIDLPALSKSEREQLKKLKDNFQQLFANDNDTPGTTTLIQHHIDLEENTRPFKLPARR